MIYHHCDYHRQWKARTKSPLHKVAQAVQGAEHLVAQRVLHLVEFYCMLQCTKGKLLTNVFWDGFAYMLRMLRMFGMVKVESQSAFSRCIELCCAATNLHQFDTRAI